MSTGASQIFVEQVREAAAILGIGGGGAAKLFATITLSATQPSTRLNAGDHIELDTIFDESPSSGILVSTGADQANGLVTLPQGHVFKVSGYLNGTFNASTVFAIHAIRNNTLAAIVSPNARTFSRNANNADSHVPIAFIDTDGGATEIEWRIISETGLIQAIGTASGVGETYLVVEEI